MPTIYITVKHFYTFLCINKHGAYARDTRQVSLL